MISLSQLYIYPVKSMRGLALSHSQVAEAGAAFDRIFMVTETDGTFITARQFPQMLLFTAALLPDGLLLSAPDGSQMTVLYHHFSSPSQPTEVWGNHFTAKVAPDVVNHWLTPFFDRPVTLRWTGEHPTRRVARYPDIPLSFADGFPYLLTNEASLADLQKRCPASVRMTQFRPNLVVHGAKAWAEDGWRVIRIGEVIFDVVKPCSRCVLTTLSPESAIRNPLGEPLATLQRFRTALENNDVDFGQNLVARNQGIVRLGDSIEILETQSPRQYRASQVAEATEYQPEAQASVMISWRDKTFEGNNQQPLLEQLETQGIRVPYSCRAGLCGCCRIQRLSGEVRELKKGANQPDGTLLCCSCVPMSDIILAPC